MARRRVVQVVVGKRERHHKQQRQHHDKQQHHKPGRHKDVRKPPIPRMTARFDQRWERLAALPAAGIVARINDVRNVQRDRKSDDDDRNQSLNQEKNSNDQASGFRQA